MKQHLDEREEKAKGQAAWYGFIGFVVLYFITCAVAVSFNQPIDSLMRIIFALSFALFIGIGIKTEAFHFRLPSLKEDDTSLEAPAYIRAVPWLLLVLGGLGFAFNGIIAGIAILIQGISFYLATSGRQCRFLCGCLRLL